MHRGLSDHLIVRASILGETDRIGSWQLNVQLQPFFLLRYIFFIAFRPLTEDHYGAVKIWLTTEICDLVENYLPEEIAARIKWGPIVPSYISPVCPCLVQCDPSDGAAIIATAQQYSPDKISAIQMAIETSSTYDR